MSATLSKHRFAVGLIMGALALVALRVSADHAETPAVLGAPMVVPYQGFLEIDGRSTTRDVRLRFLLYDGEGVEPVWQDDMVVSVVDGQFTALLGSLSPLPDDPDLFVTSMQIEVSIEDPDDAGVWYPLVDREEIVAVAYSYLSSHALDMGIDDALVVAGDTSFETSLVAGSRLGSQSRFYGETRMDGLTGKLIYIDSDDTGAIEGTGAGRPAWALLTNGPNLDLVDTRAGDDGPVRLRFATGGLVPDVQINPDGPTTLTVDRYGNLAITGDVNVLSGGISTSGGLEVTNGLAVRGDLGLTSAEVTVTDGGLEVTGALNASGHPLDAGDGLDATAGLDVTGNTLINGVVGITGEVEAGDDSAIVMRGYNLGDLTNLGIDFDIDDYNCWVGGYSNFGGSLKHDGNGNLLKALTRRDTSFVRWRVEADMHDDIREGHMVGVVCAHDWLSRRVGTWFD